jgi:diacylglycerol diphosphate phosphatase/phosphatidate phosphatase
MLIWPRCQVKPEVWERFQNDYPKVIMATVADCMQDNNYILQDGFKSFPSAHSSGTILLHDL